jgi:hypothetical protein
VLREQLLPRAPPGGKEVKGEAMQGGEVGVKGDVSKAEDKAAKSSTSNKRVHLCKERDSGLDTSTNEYIGRKIRSVSTHQQSC